MEKTEHIQPLRPEQHHSATTGVVMIKLIYQDLNTNRLWYSSITTIIFVVFIAGAVFFFITVICSSCFLLPLIDNNLTVHWNNVGFLDGEL
jgi:hypothetical protein